MNDKKSSAECRQELQTLIARHRVVINGIASLEDQLSKLKAEKNDLDGSGWGRGSGMLYHAKQRLADAELRESDGIALRIVWKDMKSPYGDQWILEKVTAKQIAIRILGHRSSAKYRLDGTSVGRYGNHRIDIRRTFGIDSDEVPPNWNPNTESDLHVQSNGKGPVSRTED